MADIFDNFTVFLQQQLELYGNEVVCERADLVEALDFSPIDASTWQNSATLLDFEKKIDTCQKCALGQSRTKFVFGNGNPNADVVFIGEAPGADEDRMGLPFVGKAGELLTKILAAIQIKREDVYICNILKCRPPHNRDPLPEEIALCKPYLAKQLELIQPKVIVCLGRISAQVLLETTASLSQMRQQWHSFNNIDVMVTYHPAALLRNPGYKRETWEDAKKLRQQLEKISGESK